MKLKTVKVRDFRHFTDLTVQNIPEAAKLIVLVGPNGCGKSSFLEALHTWYKWISRKSPQWDKEYHVKGGTDSSKRDQFRNEVTVKVHGSKPSEPKKMLYARTAYRNDPDFRAKGIGRLEDRVSEIRINRLIDNDAAVAKNYQRLVAHAVRDVFGSEDGTRTIDWLRDRILGDIRTAFKELFPELTIDGLGDPLEDGTFRLTKGTSRGYSYKNMSGGEKAVFDLILDFIMAIRDFDDTVFCIDEPETHINARLQSRLLSVLYGYVPEKCQLIIATHSIGMMRQARDIGKQNPETVVFLDFADRCFDLPQIIEPTSPNRAFWEKAYSVALDDLAALVAPERVVICEGEPVAKAPVPNHSHDARCYGRIFENEFPDTRFVSMGNAEQVLNDDRGLAATLGLLVKGIDIIRLVDRDARSSDEVDELQKTGRRVLTWRNLESCLFSDEVLQELARSKDMPDMADELVAAKYDILADREKRGLEDAPDDLKPASGEIYTACKRILRLTNPGNNTRAFMRNTLARVVHPRMSVYSELKRDIFGLDDNHSKGEGRSFQHAS